ncbi:hypothetical protein [Acinetobacter pittii]|uniref:hypothetical protein n=1 Tax=Acinetobacter pittii TaxID=48296 RepID=UPI002DB85935|nr:hypothetical protein [Acinetobacter pittii]MEB7642646.1 hypothetical protein [Acinetobacter pittii]
MSKEENKPLNILKIIIKHTGLGITDALSNGAASKLFDAYKDIRDYSKKCNDELYAKQLETFLTSMDVTQQEFEEFFRTNPDNLRLGLETIKILEKTFIEKQAEMLARALKFYISNPTEENKRLFNKFVFIINKLDRFLIDEIETIKDYPINPKPEYYMNNNNMLTCKYDGYILNANHELVNLGFLKRDISVLRPNGDEYFLLTNFFKFFYENIYIDKLKDS